MKKLFTLLISLFFSISFAMGEECPTELQSEYVFAFEGADGYCPKSFKAWKESIKGKTFEKEINRKNCILANAIHLNLKKHKKVVPKNILYYSWTETHQALKCALKLKELSSENGQEFRVKIMGFSFGGFSAIRLTKKLLKREIIPFRLLTIDPVAYNFKVFKNLFGNENPKFRRHLDGVKWDNIYQNQDNYSLRVTGIDGTSAINATSNDKIFIDPKEFKVYGDEIEVGHIVITTTPEVLDRMNEFLEL